MNLRPLEKIDALRPEQRQQLADWLLSHTLDDCVALVAEQFPEPIARSTLNRFRKRCELSDFLDTSPESARARAEIINAAASGKPNFTDPTVDLLEKQAFELADDTRNPDSLRALKDLFGLVLKHRNTCVRERMATVQERKTKLREDQFAFKKSEKNPPETYDEEKEKFIARILAPCPHCAGLEPEPTPSPFPEAVPPAPLPPREARPDFTSHLAPAQYSMPHEKTEKGLGGAGVPPVLAGVPPAHGSLTPDPALTPDQDINPQSAVADPQNPGVPPKNKTSEPPALPRKAPDFTCHMAPAQCSIPHEKTTPNQRPAPASEAQPHQSTAISHSLRRWRSHIPRRPCDPAPDDSWTRECPCGKSTPCSDHPDLHRLTRYLKPQTTEYAKLLHDAGLPYYQPTPEELGCSPALLKTMIPPVAKSSNDPTAP